MYFALIDCLRFIAAFAVMMCHYFGNLFTESDGLGGYFFRYGFLGVELFFIISGFVIYFSLQKGLKEYFIGRAVRLLPLFWFVCTFVYILTYFFANGDPLPFSVYLTNMLVLTDGGVTHMIDSVYWTLTVEIMFYVGIGFFVLLFSLKRIEFFYYIWLALSFFIFYFGAEGMFVSKLLLVRYAPYFAFGGVLGLLYKEWNFTVLSIKARRFFALFFAVILALYISHEFSMSPTLTTNNFGILDDISSVLVVSFFIIVPLSVYLSRYSSNYPKVATVTKVLGGITYPLYLIHQKLGLMMIGTWSALCGYVPTAITVVLFMLGISYILYRIDETVRKRLYVKILHFFNGK